MPEKRDHQKSKKHRTERPQRPAARAAAHNRPAEQEARPMAEAGRRQHQERA